MFDFFDFNGDGKFDAVDMFFLDQIINLETQDYDPTDYSCDEDSEDADR